MWLKRMGECVKSAFLMLGLLCVLSLTGLGGCSSSLSVGGNQQPVPLYNYERVEMFFGMSKPDGGVVTEDQFKDFIDKEVSTRFPDGFTVMPTQGQWRGKDGRIIREEGRLLILMSPISPGSKDKTSAIRETYKHRFNQESVLLSAWFVFVKF